ncbi:DUF4230 domain-containing protein [Neobacillus niacini]|uniref:DUF4230 domain-containing protein n=1 Tax=Neobacillus niacini TaxID=86668 RepID=UPI003982F65F
MAKKSQIERARKEIREGIDETAAAAYAVETRYKGSTFSWKSARILGLKNMVMVLIVLAVILTGAWVFTGSTFSKESTTFVEQVQDLAVLASAEAHVKVIMEQEDNKLFGKDIQVDIPGTKRELLLVVPATVIAGVDLKAVTADDVKIDEKNKVMELTLPHADFLQDPAIVMDQVKTFSDEGFFRSETKWDEGFNLAAEAQDEILAESKAIGLLQTAEKNAEKVLKEFFGNLGYSVKISFK